MALKKRICIILLAVLVITSIVWGQIYTQSDSDEEAGAVMVVHNIKIDPVASNDPTSVTCLVNKQFSLKDGWQPDDLVTISNNLSGDFYLRKEAAEAFETMKKAAKAAGITINVTSAYRTQAYQESLYKQYMISDPDNAPFYSAKARTSEHELGLAMDISYDNALHHDLQTSDLGKWMNDNSYQYGWIMRYPDDKIDITGYIFEAWHYRYVGPALAKALHNSGLTLEEYYQLHT